MVPVSSVAVVTLADRPTLKEWANQKPASITAVPPKPNITSYANFNPHDPCAPTRLLVQCIPDLDINFSLSGAFANHQPGLGLTLGTVCWHAHPYLGSKHSQRQLHEGRHTKPLRVEVQKWSKPRAREKSTTPQCPAENGKWKIDGHWGYQE